MTAVGVTGTHIQALASDELVQLKALGVTADFARRVNGQFGQVSPGKLVELRALGFVPQIR